MSDVAHTPAAASGFPRSPIGWHYFCETKALTRGPRSSKVGGRHIVVYRTQDGVVNALDARCCHLGADLGLGSVVGSRLKCGLHGWEFGPEGVCERIPCSENIPGFARQTRYPVEVVAGHVFVYNRPNAAYPMPFFDSVSPENLLGARPYGLAVDTPWHMVSANAFDKQHFAFAHDRRLVGDAVIDKPGPYARRIRAEFEVVGDGWRDRLTRLASGRRLTMSITVWGGLLMFVEARFRRTTTYGLLCLLPAGDTRTEAVNIIFVERGRGPVHAAIDPISAHIRRSFIRHFVAADVRLLQGLRYSPATLLKEDGVMLEYLNWLKTAMVPGAAEQPTETKEATCEHSSSCLRE